MQISTEQYDNQHSRVFILFCVEYTYYYCWCRCCCSL